MKQDQTDRGDQLALKIEGAARALTTLAPRISNLEEVELVIAQNEKAIERGYFLPNEDEQIRGMFSNYLTTRAALFSVLEDLRPFVIREIKQGKKDQPNNPKLFLVSFCTACLLLRAGRYLVETFRKQKVVWRKLDEAEPNFGIPRKQFTQVYRSLTSIRNNLIFNDAADYYEKHKTELVKLDSDPALAPIVELMHEIEEFLAENKNFFVKDRLKFRLHSFLRRQHSGFKKTTFGLFKISGSVIAEMRNQWKRKRVTPIVQRKISKILEPGDVIITRHDDATSNLFLPGFWPHGALYIGTQQQRQTLDPSGEIWDGICLEPNCILEAKKDGVLFRPLNETFNVDACVVLRPKLKPDQVRQAIAKAIPHEGKCYDFEFDFRRSDKLVCTGLIYRAYHDVGDIEFELRSRSGRMCLSAEDILDYAVEGKYFDVMVVYGTDGNRFVTGERAMPALITSYRKDNLPVPIPSNA